uniref:Cytochrome P450 n=1 Tax=Fagus sylvatica TaxID=28930 RepID=A0A2N9GUK9_FAGSY
MIWIAGSWVLAFGVAWVVHRIYKWYNPKCNGLLPPGSMGLPFIGETLQLMEAGYSFDIVPFLKKRLQRYGPIFRTSVAGRQVRVSADPQFNHFIFQEDWKLFESWYLDSFAKIFEQEGASSLVLMWLTFTSTAYYKCMKDRKKAMNMVREVLKQRLASPPEKRQGDFLDHVIQDMNSQDFLTEDFVVQLFFGLLYVSFDTISTMTTLTFKLLDENPDVLQELIVEHEAILKKREKPGSSITWNEYKSMSFTLQVINEVLRLGNMTPGLFRRTLADVQVNGYTIPAGWPIMIATSALHLNSEIFNDPLAFNPWRWKDRKSNEMSKNFMPFGEGMKQCAGAEYTRVFLAIFIHVLVTKYRWMKIMGGDICRNPFIGFGKGLHIKVMEN